MSLLAWWKFDETSGSSFADSSGNSRTLTASGTVNANATAISSNSVSGKAVDLAGGALTRTGDSTLRNLVNGWTVGCWINFDSMVSDSHVIGMAFSTSINFGLMHNRDSAWGSGKFGVGFYDGAWREVYYNTALSTGTTYFLCGTYDGTTLKFYLDGTLVASGTPGGSNVASGGDLLVGRYWVADSDHQDGRLDDGFICSDVLTATQISDIYADANALAAIYAAGSVAASDSVTLSDAATATGARSRAIADSVTFSDTAIKTTLRTAADSITATDAVTRSVGHSGAAADSITLTDAVRIYRTYALPSPGSMDLSSTPPTLALGTSLNFVLPAAALNLGAAVAALHVAPSVLALGVPTPAVVAFSSRAPYLTFDVTALGDDFYNPVVLHGLTGAVSIDFDLMGEQPDEPADALRTFWMLYESVSLGRLTVVTADASLSDAAPWRMQSFYGSDVDALVLGDDTFDADVPVAGLVTDVHGPATYVRVTQTVDTDAMTLDLAWTYEPYVDAFVLDLATTWVDRAPNVLKFSVLGAAAGVRKINATVLGTGISRDYAADTAGIVSNALLQLPASLGAGTYTLEVIDYGNPGVSERATFTVAGAPLTRPAPPPADLPAVLVPQVGIVRWTLQDPMPGGLGSYVVPINPREMSDPDEAIYLTPDRTTAPDGQWHFWEGAPRATTWRFRGDILTQEHLEAWESFAALERRFYIIDHRSRAWRVTLESFDPAPQIGTNRWHHKYEATALVYGPAVQL